METYRSGRCLPIRLCRRWHLPPLSILAVVPRRHRRLVLFPLGAQCPLEWPAYLRLGSHQLLHPPQRLPLQCRPVRAFQQHLAQCSSHPVAARVVRRRAANLWRPLHNSSRSSHTPPPPRSAVAAVPDLRRCIHPTVTPLRHLQAVALWIAPEFLVVLLCLLPQAAQHHLALPLRQP